MEFDILTHPHPHSLTFYQQGRLDGGQEVFCSNCREPWRPPVLSCSISDCNFHLHLSCIKFPPQIHSPFHPQHPLGRTITTSSCSACGKMPSAHAYRCSECDFQIDVICAIADTKAPSLQRTATGAFLHFSHSHPLTLQTVQEMGSTKAVCLVCQMLIKSGSTYFCSHSGSYFHPQCAERPRQILNLDYHDHPLFLFPRPFVHNSACHSCKNGCVDFFYACPLCNFNLHVGCLSSFKHKHAFVNFRGVVFYTCQACGKSESGFPWFCSICHFVAHKKCALSPLILQTSEHHHSLTLTFFLKPIGFTNNMCKICGAEMNTSFGGYVCDKCSYVAHLDCAQNWRIEKTENKEEDVKCVKGDNGINSENGILHFSHEHKLMLIPCSDEDRLCDGCMRCISRTAQSYGCGQCKFFLHEECVRLPTHKNCLFHKHSLHITYTPDVVFSCGVCLQYCHGFAYHCEECTFTIDIRCAAIAIPFTHPSHVHPLYFYCTNEGQNCECCEKRVEYTAAFRCIDCNFHLDARCATLPLCIKNRFDEHPLNLTFVKEDEGVDEYYCDICEEERDGEQWFYYCRLCCFAGHQNCVLGDYPFLKSTQFEGHRHPLNLVREGKKGYSGCNACGDCCDGNLTYECGRCKFNIHAFGLCYHKQFMQDRITFTMPSPYSRSLTLCLQPNERRESKHIILEQYGGIRGNPWKERAFSTIKRLVINHGQWIDSIQIEYEKDGKSLTSEIHGGNGGSRSEVVLDYPNEYLVTIHGYYGDINRFGIATTLVRSLTLRSNIRSHGPFGVEEGTKFSFLTEGKKIVGIHGKSDNYLHSIGLIAIPIHV